MTADLGIDVLRRDYVIWTLKQLVEVSLRIITYLPVIKRYEERQVRLREERNRKYEHKWGKSI